MKLYRHQFAAHVQTVETQKVMPLTRSPIFTSELSNFGEEPALVFDEGQTNLGQLSFLLSLLCWVGGAVDASTKSIKQTKENLF